MTVSTLEPDTDTEGLTEDETASLLAWVARQLKLGRAVLCGQCRELVYDPTWTEATGITCKGCLPLA